MGPLGAEGAEFREVTFCAQAHYLRAICLELDVHFGPKVIPSSLGSPRCPQWPHGVQGSQKGDQSDAKEAALGVQGTPKGPNRKPKVAPRRAKWQNELNKSQNYIHISKIHANSRSTAIQRPTSITIYVYFEGVCLNYRHPSPRRE